MFSFQVDPKLNRDAVFQYREFLLERHRETVSKNVLLAACQSVEQETRRQTQYAQAPSSDPNAKRAREMYQVAQIMTGSFLGGVTLAQNFAKRLDDADEESFARHASTLDWGFWLPLDQRLAKQLLDDDLQMLLQVGDEDQNWLARLEEALRLYAEANFSNDFFRRSFNALIDLLASAKRESGRYVLSQRIGTLLLYHPDFLDLPRAERIFLDAVGAIEAESEAQMKRLLCTLARQGSKGMIQDFDSLKRRLASEHYFHAGVSRYARADYKRAAELFETAYYLFSTPELDYLLAKSFLAVGRIGDFVRVLANLLKKNEFYMLKASLDGGFASLPNVLDALSSLRDALQAEVRVKMQTMRSAIVEDSQALRLLDGIDKRSKERSCFSILQARNEIERPRRWILTPRVFQPKSLVLGHSLRVNAMRFSHDSRLLATASWKVLLNDAETGAELRDFPGLTYKSTINVLAFSPDNRSLAGAGSDKRVLIWDIESGNLTRVFAEHTQSVIALAFSPNSRYLASAGVDRSIIVWNPFTGDIVFRLKGHDHSVSKIAFSPDSQLLASASFDKTIAIWDLKTGKKLLSLNRHSHAVTSVEFSSDGKTLVSSSWDKTVKVWELATGMELQTFHGHANGVDSATFLFQEKWVASTSFNRASKVCCVKLWETSSGREMESCYGRFYGATFSPDASKLAIASADRTVKILAAPEMSLSDFVAFEQKLRLDIEAARKQESALERRPRSDDRRKGERRKPSFWIGGVDLRSGKDRRKSS